jgi:hypothetical protein
MQGTDNCTSEFAKSTYSPAGESWLWSPNALDFAVAALTVAACVSCNTLLNVTRIAKGCDAADLLGFRLDCACQAGTRRLVDLPAKAI